MQLEGSTFIVTGGASGLGEASARTLHGGGANVVIADVQVERGEALARELGARARFARTDVTSEADGQAAVALALSALRRPAGAGQLRRHRHRREDGGQGGAASARLASRG